MASRNVASPSSNSIGFVFSRAQQFGQATRKAGDPIPAMSAEKFNNLLAARRIKPGGATGTAGKEN